MAGDDPSWGEEEGYPILRAVAGFVRTEPAAFDRVSKDRFVLPRTSGSA